MERNIHPRLRILLVLALVAGLASCAVLEEIRLPEFKTPDTPREAKTETEKRVELPTIVAVMPFANETQAKDAADRVRKSFYNFFSSAPYVDIELAAVDEGIVRLERSTGRSTANMKPQEICQAIGCDGLLFGRVTDYQKTFGGVYSRLRAEVEIWMVDVRTGKEVMRVRDSVDYLEGGIPLSPLGAIMSALSSAANVREIQETRMVAELAAKLVAKVPVPAGAQVVTRPAIRELITNAGESPFGSGKIVRVGLQGEPGSVAVFDIGNFKRGLPMRETQPGVYLGEYAVLPGDSTRDMPIIAYLKRPSGPESQWIDTSGLVAIDTVAPQKVSGLRAKGYRDRVEISWESLPDTTGLAAYRVLRSEQPLNGFRQIATAGVNTFEDRAVKPGALYYYRVVAVDNSGNASEPSSTVSARLATKDASVLSGEAKSDTVLSGIYVLNGQFTIPRGVSLTIGPETSILAEKEASILVQGKLTVDGTNGQVRLFSRRAEKWAGVALDGGHVTMKGVVLSGAKAGLTLKESAGVVENVSVTDNDVGIYISGVSGVVVRNCWVAGNKTGIALVGTDAKIVQSVIVRNGTGLSLKGFTGEVSENIIVDNEQNIFSDFPLKLDPNYIGEFRERDMPSLFPLRGGSGFSASIRPRLPHGFLP
jgi:hypothetical protein